MERKKKPRKTAPAEARHMPVAPGPSGLRFVRPQRGRGGTENPHPGKGWATESRRRAKWG